MSSDPENVNARTRRSSRRKPLAALQVSTEKDEEQEGGSRSGKPSGKLEKEPKSAQKAKSSPAAMCTGEITAGNILRSWEKVSEFFLLDQVEGDLIRSKDLSPPLCLSLCYHKRRAYWRVLMRTPSFTT